MNKLIVFFDGPCVLCNFWVQKLCRWDTHDRLYFASLQSDLAQQFIKERGLDIEQLNSVITWDQEFSYFTESKAVFTIIRKLGFPWYCLAVFSIIPNKITNWIYRLIAKNRYRWFGMYEQCPLPKPKYAHKFI